MTKEQVIAWARQAGGVQLFTPAEFGAHAKTKTDTHISMTTDALERFATLVRNAALTEALNSYSPDDTAADYLEKIEDLKEPTP